LKLSRHENKINIYFADHLNNTRKQKNIPEKSKAQMHIPLKANYQLQKSLDNLIYNMNPGMRLKPKHS
jgi:hypothetical protein